MNRTTGTTVTASLAGMRYEAFIPNPLPPQPPLVWSEELGAWRDRANRGIGRLDGISEVLPDRQLFIYQYVRKEAVLSSQIEGTQSSLSDLLLFELEESPGAPLDDVQEVSNYVAAMTYGLERIRDGFPVSLRLFNEIHAILMHNARGADKQPGVIRRSQVWLGGSDPRTAIFVPPPPDQVMKCLDPFERFLHDATVPVLEKAALAHVQFETIHPYKDGNGRLGRLMITLLLCAEDVLRQPLLYLSLYFKQNRQEYYDRLQAVRTEGDWEGWMLFFFKGVYETSRQAVDTAQALLTLFRRDEQRLQDMGRKAQSAVRLQHFMQRRPITSVSSAARHLALSKATVNTAMDLLVAEGIAREITGKQRYRRYVYEDYLNTLAEGTGPL